MCNEFDRKSLFRRVGHSPRMSRCNDHEKWVFRSVKAIVAYKIDEGMLRLLFVGKDLTAVSVPRKRLRPDTRDIMSRKLLLQSNHTLRCLGEPAGVSSSPSLPGIQRLTPLMGGRSLMISAAGRSDLCSSAIRVRYGSA